MTVEEARTALGRAIGQLLILPGHDQPPLLERRAAVMAAADAYARAAHVDACEKVGIANAADKDRTFPYIVCGDGWYCDKGLAIGGKQ